MSRRCFLYEMLNPANESRPLGLMAIVGLFYVLTGMLQPTLGSGPVTVLRAIGLILVPAIIMAPGHGWFRRVAQPGQVAANHCSRAGPATC